MLRLYSIWISSFIALVDSADTNEPGLGDTVRSLEEYVRSAHTDIWEYLQAGSSWNAAVQMERKLEAAGTSPLSLQDMGSLRALLEIALIELTLSSQSRILLASNITIDDGREDWMRNLAIDLQNIALAMPGDRHTIAVGYIALYWLMMSSFKPDEDGFVRMESYSSLTQAWWLARQAASASTQRICEVGFNGGHSALAMLASAPAHATMVSFDLVSKSYTPACSDFLSKVFPHRFSLISGPSNETIPQYARAHFDMPRCDLVYIDGGHEFEEARDDLLAMSLLSHGRTLVVMDDVGCTPEYCIGATQAWQAFQNAGRLKELGCQAEEERRWCWGVYL